MFVLEENVKVVDSGKMELIASISRIMDKDVHKLKEVPKLRIMQRTLPSIMKIY